MMQGDVQRGTAGTGALSSSKVVAEDWQGRAWNVIATAKELEQRHLARLLKRFGDFRWTAFRGLLVGRVEDHVAFFEQLTRCEQDDPGFLDPVARIIPVDRTFTFTVDDFPTKLREAVRSYVDRINGGSFYVRVERRGHKGEIHSQELEQQMDHAVVEAAAESRLCPTVDFKDPDVIIAVETVGEECGVGVITRELRRRYPFIKVP